MTYREKTCQTPACPPPEDYACPSYLFLLFAFAFRAKRAVLHNAINRRPGNRALLSTHGFV